jgi:hypothetical protein
MTLTLELTPQVEERISREAKARGLTIEAYIRSVLEGSSAGVPAGQPSSDERTGDLPRSNGASNFTARIIGDAPRAKDRSREWEWLATHRGEYAGEWLALDGDRMLAHGLDLKEVAETAKRDGVTDALLVRAEPINAPPYIGM